MYYTQALHRAAQQHPQRIASIFGERRRTYAELTDRVARLAGALQGLGMAPGDRIAMLSLNSDRYFEYLFAVPWGGGVLNPCNIRWSVAEILYSLEDSGSSMLLVDDAFLPMARTLMAESGTLRRVIYCGDDETPAGMLDYEALIAGHEPVEDRVRRGDDLLGVFYTGGTTGFPKGVMISHEGMGCSTLALHAELGPSLDGGVYLHAAPMFHLADMAGGGVHWLAGNTHVVVPMFGAEAVIDAIEQHRVTHTLLVPTMIQMLVDHPSLQQGRDLYSLRTIIYGASPISEAVLERAMARLPGIDFVQAYGMTEMSPLIAVNPAWTHRPEHRACGKLRAAGRSGLCVQVRIVDGDGNEVPRGTIGEIAARGPNMMLGYWDNQEATDAVVRNGWMHTGDGAWMDEDGFIFIVDRVKDMIVTGGENVYSVEVENAVLKHPAVFQCAVIGIPDDRWGELVHACVVLNPGMTLELDELVGHCKQHVANYKCPRSLEILESLPMSGAGKIVKNSLRDRHWAGQARRVG
ncbi:long-chain-fatty-acid--CoA ligase [Pseudomonas schmalbachii]|uniref:Long-chain-fatty-acid--CoA ligase n=1 Tax=Pseudomonas schmalbachii TaxID=2816993 RepID=A0ABS3TJ22_9PSED|nr:long-chain-fatty-acid--CoA ligase [Pseudomonas schmalbachii]MBO3273655.1 long-chain-fatty-acid--CoA ligase [Pseudomonas schmalbachii]